MIGVLAFGGRRRGGFLFALATTFLAGHVALAAPVAGMGQSRFTLVTLGPGSDLFELWGHSALCVSSGAFEEGTCYDYGWSSETDAVSLALGTLRGEPLFVPKKWPARAMLEAYQFRDFWTQELPLEESAQRSLLARLEADVVGRRAYSYEPVLENCTTRLRDSIDSEIGGRLSAGGQGRPGASLRSFADHALRGRVVPLMLLALAGGQRLDTPTNEWARMAFPHGLMESIERHQGARPERLFSRLDQRPPTSPDAGRVVLVLLALASAIGIVATRRASARAQTLLRSGLALWLTALSLVPILGIVSALPSLHRNWAVAVLIPTDIILFLGSRQVLSKYVALRLVLTSLILGLSLSGLMTQSLWVPCLLVLLPFLALQFSARTRAIASIQAPIVSD